ncbi:MAG: hypothetical protein PWQ09_1111 [Candidatus Cloacimonadota bacterium]|jgi:hypothetical protein|nr:hypothetical protein [Candidatus Cloacimonadota bacterium]
MSCKQDEIKTKNLLVMLKIGGMRVGLVALVHDALLYMIVAFTNNLKAYSGDDIEITIRASQQK